MPSGAGAYRTAVGLPGRAGRVITHLAASTAFMCIRRGDAGSPSPSAVGREVPQVLVASGYPLEIPGANFLAKPYSPLDLVRRIQQVLSSHDEPAAGKSLPERIMK